MMVPRSRPQQKREASEKILTKAGVTDAVSLLGIRGYYLNSMGKPKVNDRGIYDDAIFIVSPNAYVSFNANTDPSVHRKGIASLLPGLYRYRKGRHGISSGPGYPALRPATKNEALPVWRDNEGQSIGYHINIHRGGNNTTSSLGCQTIVPAQWQAFISLVYEEMDRYGQKTIPYLLIENK
jgi:lysozyme